jgi:hypothetical protein
VNPTAEAPTPFEPPRPRAGRLRAALLLVAVLVAGALAGGAGTLLAFRRAVFHPPAGGWANRRILAVTSRQLDLDEAQRERIDTILRETRGELLDITDRVEPEVRAVLEKARGRIRSELRPNQQPRFDAEVEKRRKELEALRKRLRG